MGTTILRAYLYWIMHYWLKVHQFCYTVESGRVRLRRNWWLVCLAWGCKSGIEGSEEKEGDAENEIMLAQDSILLINIGLIEKRAFSTVGRRVHAKVGSFPSSPFGIFCFSLSLFRDFQTALWAAPLIKRKFGWLWRNEDWLALAIN